MPKGIYRIRNATTNEHSVYVRYVVGDDVIPQERYRMTGYKPSFDALRWSDEPAKLRIEFICDANPTQREQFAGSIDDAIIAAAEKIKSHEATLARIVDDQSGEVLKVVLSAAV
jgi:hypothetical protein